MSQNTISNISYINSPFPKLAWRRLRPFLSLKGYQKMVSFSAQRSVIATAFAVGLGKIGTSDVREAEVGVAKVGSAQLGIAETSVP